MFMVRKVIFMHKNTKMYRGFFSDKILMMIISVFLLCSLCSKFHPDVDCRLFLLADYNEKKSAEYYIKPSSIFIVDAL